jgi:predicted MFS family arabinose efflux permease
LSVLGLKKNPEFRMSYTHSKFCLIKQYEDCVRWLAPEARGKAVSLFIFSFFVGQGIGAAAFGRIVDNFGYIYCFILVGIAIALLCVWLVKQKQYST